MELGGGKRNNDGDHGRIFNRPLRRQKVKPIYDDNLSEVEEVEVEDEVQKQKYCSMRERERIANQKLKDFGHDENPDSIPYEEKMNLIEIYEESKKTAKLHEMASSQYRFENFEEEDIVDVEEEEGSLYKDHESEKLLSSNRECINRLRSRNVSVVSLDQASSTVSRETPITLFDSKSIKRPENPVSDTSSQGHQSRQTATLRLEKPSISRIDPSIPFMKENSLRISSERAAYMRAILKKRQEEDWFHSDCSHIKDREERRKLVAERLKQQSKIIFENRIKKQSKHVVIENRFETLTEAQSVRFFKEWRAKKNKTTVENDSHSPDIIDDSMDQTEPSSQIIPSKFQALGMASLVQDDDDEDEKDFIETKKKTSRLYTRTVRKAKTEWEDSWLSKNNAEMENKNANLRNSNKRKLYSGSSVLGNPNEGSRFSQSICDNATSGKKKRQETENDNMATAEEFDTFLSSYSNQDDECAKLEKDDRKSPEF